MNIRKLKKIIQARIDYDNFRGQWSRLVSKPWVDVRGADTALVLQDIVEAVTDHAGEFVCVKVNGGDVVDTFDTVDEAFALVNKHIKQRKAKLQVIDSITGALVFLTQETA